MSPRSDLYDSIFGPRCSNKIPSNSQELYFAKMVNETSFQIAINECEFRQNENSKQTCLLLNEKTNFDSIEVSQKR